MGTEAAGRADRLPTRRMLIGPACVEILDSGPTRWVFDLARHRFGCVPHDIDLDATVLQIPWRQYERLEPTLDGRGIVVTTKRATLHLRAC
jgi:hypothetical protein